MAEYPFKDLLPLDEVLEREGYYNDWTHLDPEVFYSLTQISEYIKTKGYGVDVRLLIAQLAEHFGLKSTQIIDLANLLQQQFTGLEEDTQSFTDNMNSLVAQMEADKDAVIANATVDSEVILARGGKPTLQARLDETEMGIGALEELETEHKNNIVNAINSFHTNFLRFKLDNPISPEDFEGSDYEKIQQALDLAIETERPLKFGLMYDITGQGALMINKERDILNRRVTYLYGSGGIEKHDAGYIFDAPEADVGDINIRGLRFVSTRGSGTTVWNCNKLIRINSMFNEYADIDTVAEANLRYLQSCRFEYEHIVYGQGWAFTFEECWDTSISNNLIENRQHGIGNASESTKAVNRTLRVKNNVIEGLTGQAIKLGACYATTISSNYFESNLVGDIDLETLNKYYHIGITVSENMISVHANRRDTDYAIKVSGLQTSEVNTSEQHEETQKLSLNNDFSGNVTTAKLFKKTGAGYLISRSNYEAIQSPVDNRVLNLTAKQKSAPNNEQNSGVTTTGIMRHYQRFQNVSLGANASLTYDIPINNGNFQYPVKMEDIITVYPKTTTGVMYLKVDSIQPTHVSTNNGMLRIRFTNTHSESISVPVVINILKMFS